MAVEQRTIAPLASRSLRKRLSDPLRFAVSMVADPSRVAALAPSSPVLARMMTSEIDVRDGPIIELGPGTGVFTRQLLARGVPEEDIAMVELGKEFADMLAKRFPRAHLLRCNAAELAGHQVFPGRKAGAVISGLPVLAMRREIVDRILRGIFTNLRPGGRYYQFTYRRRPPIPASLIQQHGLTVDLVGQTWRNLPPARVFRFSQPEPE